MDIVTSKTQDCMQDESDVITKPDTVLGQVGLGLSSALISHSSGIYGRDAYVSATLFPGVELTSSCICFFPAFTSVLSYILLGERVAKINLSKVMMQQLQLLSVNGACPSLVIRAVPTPVKTTPELSGPAFGVLSKTGNEELEDRGTNLAENG